MKQIAIACALFGALLLQPVFGQTPTWQKMNSGAQSGFKGVHMIDTKRGYVVGTGPDFGPGLDLRRTTDGGTTWTAIEIPGATQGLWGVYASPGPAGDTICVVGDNGAVHRSVDGGAHWTTPDLHFSEGFTFSLSGVDAKNMYATGYEGSESNQQGLVIATHDGGETWLKTPVAGAGTFDKSFFLTPQLGYAVGGKPGGFSKGGLVMKTTDGGLNWSTAATTPYSMNSIYCFDENNWMAVGYQGIAIRTSDGGKNWKKMTMPAAQAADPYTHILFVNDEIGFITDVTGPMLKTTDGGDTWTRDNSFIAGSTLMWSMSKAESATEIVVIAVGESGSIYRYKIKKEQQQPAAELSETELDFGKVLEGSKEMELEISPKNQLGLRIDSIYIASPANGFTLAEPVGPFPMELQGSGFTDVKVRFTYDASLGDAPEGHLIIKTNDPAHTTIDIPLSAQQKDGSGGGGDGAPVLSATSLAFGKVERDGTKDMTFTVAASTAAGLKVNSFSVENESVPGTFTVVSPTGPFPMTVQMGTPLTVTVRFKPAQLAAETADLYIANNSGSGDLHVTLAGEGVKPVASVRSEDAAAGLTIALNPNPIATSGSVAVELPRAGRLVVELYDMRGSRAAILFEGDLEAGVRAIPLDASALPSGVYTCVARVGSGAVSTKVTIDR